MHAEPGSRVLALLTVIIPYTLCDNEDNNTAVFRNCEQIDYCSDLRFMHNNVPFIANFDDIQKSDDSVLVPLKQSGITINITLLRNYIGRIKIKNTHLNAYELQDVLDEEPERLSLVMVSTEADSFTIQTRDPQYTHKVVVSANPLNIEFYYDDNTLISSIDSEQLNMISHSDEFGFAVKFNEVLRLYGLHHHATNLELAPTMGPQGIISDPIRLRNSDIYTLNATMALYGSAPVIYAHSENHTSGIFLHNAAEQWIDITFDENRATSYFIVGGGMLDLFVLFGPTPKNVVRQITYLTGLPHLPQLWTLGYHQSRWSYYTQEDVKYVVAQMDAHDFPMDSIWLDIDYTDGYRYFTWNPVNFTDPIELQKNLSSTNRKLVVISDPHIKVDRNYDVYAQAQGKYFVKWRSGSDFEGYCWPGLSSYLDFLNPEARIFYANLYSYKNFKNTDSTLAGIWNDMNEPSVFNDIYERTLPFTDVLHYGDVLHRDIHNIYGLLQTKATHQGLMLRNEKRPFILTRSHFVGTQRYAAMWTGDIKSDWPNLRVSYSECLASNLIGLVFCGADVPGFVNDPETELVIRWYQAGIWIPFYRGHAHIDTKRREPYLFEEYVQTLIRNAIKTRYQHIPQWYTLFYEHIQTGDPLIRPLFYEYPGLVDKNDHILLGSNILARPVLEKAATFVNVTFPGTPETYWYRIDKTNALYVGGTEASLSVDLTMSPYFYKGGGIITRKDIVGSSTAATKNDPYSLYVNIDNNNSSTGYLYLDDFTTFLYQDNDYAFALYHFVFNLGKSLLEIKVTKGNSFQYELKLSDVIVNKKSSLNEYEQTIYTKLANGTSLQDLIIDPSQTSDKKIILKF